MSNQNPYSLQLREFALTSNVATAICDGQFFRAGSRLVPGATLVFGTITKNSFLSNSAVTLTSASATKDGAGRWTLVFAFAHSDVLGTGDSGDIVLSNPVSDPGARPISDAAFPAWVKKDQEFKASQLQTPSDGGKGTSHP
jgi:hypothetical protein